MSDPRVEYGRRIARWDEEIARNGRTSLYVSNMRLAAAAAAAFVLLMANRGTLSNWWLVVPAALFVILMIVHARVLENVERARRARRLYERGLARLDGTWHGTGPDGARFLDQHPFARDLDLFGPASLFQLLHTARTEIGEETLAGWLGAVAETDEIRRRQAAVAELVPTIDFREAIAVLAAAADVGRTSALARWGAQPPAGLSRATGISSAVSALVTATLGVAVVTAGLDPGTLFAWLVIQTGVVLFWRPRVRIALGRVEAAAHDLALLAVLLERVERQAFTSPRLTALRDALVTDGMPPSRRIAQLERLIGVLDSSRNQLIAPIAALLLVRTQVAAAIDRWHRAHGPAIDRWLLAIGELEALSALATYAFEHPADPFPTLDDEQVVFEAEGLGHPLIAEPATVRNDVRLGGHGARVLIVSGSNMSGKSTLLRAVGVNAVLALAGAPVRASGLRMSRVVLGATLRIEDSLQAGHSKFYAEILRIRAIVDLTGGSVPLLFLLDEILGGTNSYDRRIGADAIVRALVDRGAIGLVTTHDLALTDLATTLGAAAANVHFEDRIENGTMVFDYRMRPGVVERSNALALMRAVGLDV